MFLTNGVGSTSQLDNQKEKEKGRKNVGREKIGKMLVIGIVSIWPILISY